MSPFYIRLRPVFKGKPDAINYIHRIEAPDAETALARVRQGDSPELYHQTELATEQEWEAEVASRPHSYLVSFPLMTDEGGQFILEIHSSKFDGPDEDNEEYAKQAGIDEVETEGGDHHDPIDYGPLNTDPAVVTCRKVTERELQLMNVKIDASIG